MTGAPGSVPSPGHSATPSQKLLAVASSTRLSRLLLGGGGELHQQPLSTPMAATSAEPVAPEWVWIPLAASAGSQKMPGLQSGTGDLNPTSALFPKAV